MSGTRTVLDLETLRTGPYVACGGVSDGSRGVFWGSVDGRQARGGVDKEKKLKIFLEQKLLSGVLESIVLLSS